VAVTSVCLRAWMMRWKQHGRKESGRSGLWRSIAKITVGSGGISVVFRAKEKRPARSTSRSSKNSVVTAGARERPRQCPVRCSPANMYNAIQFSPEFSGNGLYSIASSKLAGA
jgi:hypothetical protein